MNSKNNIDEKLKEIVNKVVQTFQPEKIILFGSYAWGEPTENSDVDLFVVKQTSELKRERQLKLRYLFLDFDIAADGLVFTPSEVEERIKMGDFFIRNIIHKGKLLYESK
ncbi:MAG: nucleotidyltransferase domain-containing protein [Candidatus Firestonebacteria bacterium]